LPQTIKIEPILSKEIVNIAKRLVCSLTITEEEESESRLVTKTNLNNMLKVARLARERKDYGVFEIGIAYIARNTEYDDELNWFVRQLLSELRLLFKRIASSRGLVDIGDEEKIAIAEDVLKLATMLYSARSADIRGICSNER